MKSAVEIGKKYSNLTILSKAEKGKNGERKIAIDKCKKYKEAPAPIQMVADAFHLEVA